jgi:hypothetical protein
MAHQTMMSPDLVVYLYFLNFQYWLLIFIVGGDTWRGDEVLDLVYIQLDQCLLFIAQDAWFGQNLVLGWWDALQPQVDFDQGVLLGQLQYSPLTTITNGISCSKWKTTNRTLNTGGWQTLVWKILKLHRMYLTKFLGQSRLIPIIFCLCA